MRAYMFSPSELVVRKNAGRVFTIALISLNSVLGNVVTRVIVTKLCNKDARIEERARAGPKNSPKPPPWQNFETLWLTNSNLKKYYGERGEGVNLKILCVIVWWKSTGEGEARGGRVKIFILKKIYRCVRAVKVSYCPDSREVAF